MVKSTGFRLASILIPTILLVILGGVVLLALRDNPATRVTTTVQTPAGAPSVATEATPDPTPTPPVFLISNTPPVTLDGALRYAEAGLSFGPPQGYLLDLAEQAAILTAQESSPAAGTILVLRQEDPSDYAPSTEVGNEPANGEAQDAALESVFQAFVEFYARQDGFVLGETADLTIGGQPARAVDLLGQAAGDFGGRIALAQPTPHQLFVMIGVAPTDIWRTQGLADYMAVLDTVTFLDLPASTQATTPATPAAEVSTPIPEPTATAEPTPVPTAEPTEVPTVEPTPEPTESPTAEPVPTEPAAQIEIPAATVPLAQLIEQLPARALDADNWTLETNGNYVTRLARRADTLWAATTGGAVAWNLASGNQATFTTADGLVSNHLTAVATCEFTDLADPLGVVFGSDAGIQVFAPEAGTWRTFSQESGDLSANDVADVFCDPQSGYLAVLYSRAGADLYDANTQTWTRLPLDMATLEAEVGALRRITATQLEDAARGTLWIGAQRGLLRLTGDFEAVDRAPSSLSLTILTPANSPLLTGEVSALAPIPDAPGSLWVAGNGAFYRTDGETWESITPDSIEGERFPQGRINGLALAADNTVWIASDQTSLCRYDPAANNCAEFHAGAPGMVDGPLSSLVLDAGDSPLYGTMGNGIARLSSAAAGRTWEPLVIDNPPSMGNTIRSLAMDTQGALWIGANSGATRRSGAGYASAVHYTPANSPLPFADVTVVGPGAQGNSIWFGGSEAALFDGSNWRAFGVEDGLVDAPIQVLTADGVGRTWLGSQGAGISIWTGSNFFNLTRANGLPSEDITALASSGDVVWIGTRGGGLLRFQNNQLRFFSARDTDLPSNTITALAIQSDGSVLIGTDRGLARAVDNQVEVLTALPAAPVTALAVPTTSNTGEFWLVLNETTLVFYDGADFARIEPTALWPATAIRALQIDASGTLWLGFQRGGLVRYAP